MMPLNCFELEQLIDDAWRSINYLDGGAWQNQLLDLSDRLEAAEPFDDGMLDVL